MMKRKLEEIGSTLYRRLIFPFLRIGLEKKTDSILKQGSYLNKGSVLMGRNFVGKETVLSGVELGFGSYVSNYGDLSYIRIGKYSSIGPYVRTVLGKHPVSGFAALHPAFYSQAGQMGFTYVGAEKNGAGKKEGDFGEGGFSEEAYLDEKKRFRVIIGNDVWIGQGVSLLEGIRIGDGAVIGAGSVVTKDIEPYTVCAGVPAKKIRDRFDRETAKKLEGYTWWEKDENWIRDHIRDFRDTDSLIEALEKDGS